MFDHVCREELCLIQEPGNMSSFLPLARQANVSQASVQCDRGFRSLALPSHRHPSVCLHLSFLLLSTRAFGGECYSSSSVEICRVQHKQVGMLQLESAGQVKSS